MVQDELIAKFNDEKRPKFNPIFFHRDEMDIVEELKKVILSAQRDKFFTIKVESFRVISDYAEVYNTLYQYEELYSKNRRAKDNEYSYINLRDSDIILLEVNYFISIKDQSEHTTVLIQIPRVIDKYYFKIAGNMYSALYQIVDASTYNNATSSSKKHKIVLKTIFTPINIYRNTKKAMKSFNGDTVKCLYYDINVFTKTVPIMKYFFARFGFYGAINFMGLSYISVTNYPMEEKDETYYSFMKNNIWINCPRFMYDNNTVVQSIVYTIYKAIMKDTSYQDLYLTEFWAKSLGMEFNNSTPEKGYAVLDSIENVYDIQTKYVLHLPEEQKADIYCVLRWMISEFAELRKKDNTDLTTKRIRYAEYLASLYAMKLTQGIHRVSDIANRAEIKTIKRAIEINPGYLVQAIANCKLVNYKNLVNDLDAVSVLKYSFKGISGIGEKGSSAVPQQFKMVNPSHIGRVDMDSSSASDPGMSGALCPLQRIYGESISFSEFEEPNTWQEELAKTLTQFREMTGRKELFIAEEVLLGKPHNDEVEKLEEDIQAARRIIRPFIHTDEGEYGGLPLEGSGLIQLIAE